MKSTEKLYESFGELLYVVAMADGQIQASEMAVILSKLAEHPWGAKIQWSFDYEVKKQNKDLEDLYNKVITYCEMHGPEKEYTFLIELMEEVAQVSGGIDKDEQNIMDSFVFDLTEKFRKDIDRIQNG